MTESVKQQTAVLSTRYSLDAEGVVRFPLTLRGLSGRDWVKEVRTLGGWVTQNAADMLLAPGFQQTSPASVTVVILPARLWSTAERRTEAIRTEAVQRKLLTPHPEVACLTRMKFSNEEIRAMGFNWLLCMHTLINGVPPNLRTDVLSLIAVKNTRWLSSDNSDTTESWGDRDGFMFIESQPA